MGKATDDAAPSAGAVTQPKYSSQDHRFHVAVRWAPEDPAVEIAEGVYMSSANSNRYLVTTPDGDVLINTGQSSQAVRHRERFEQLLGRPLRVKKIIYTQSHADHYSGWEIYDDSGVETLAHTYFHEGVLDRQRLSDFFKPRRANTTAWRRQGASARMPGADAMPSAHITTQVEDGHAFTLGGRRFEILSAPGGETPDSVFVWMPEEAILFTGNHAGALYGAMPNFTTIRGDRIRSTRLWVLDVNRMLALKPRLLVTGHDDPIHGEAQIRKDYEKIRDAVLYVHDATVQGMNDGKSLHQLMGEIELPASLTLADGRCPTRWVVRSVWEEYTGWFRFESPTELYAQPPRSVWKDIFDLAGGDKLAERAWRYMDDGKPVEALHLVDIILEGDPDHARALAVKRAAIVHLIDASEGRNYDEITYLESVLARLDATGE